MCVCGVCLAESIHVRVHGADVSEKKAFMRVYTEHAWVIMGRAAGNGTREARLVVPCTLTRPVPSGHEVLPEHHAWCVTSQDSRELDDAGGPLTRLRKFVLRVRPKKQKKGFTAGTWRGPVRPVLPPCRVHQTCSSACPSTSHGMHKRLRVRCASCLYPRRRREHALSRGLEVHGHRRQHGRAKSGRANRHVALRGRRG